MSATLPILFLLAIQAPSPQSAPLRDAIRTVEPGHSLIGVVSDVIGPEGLDLGKLGLGDGGLATERHEGQRDGDGFYRTAGGVELQARAAGVKFDFPAGGDLVIDASGAINLRSGERTVAFRSGLRLVLADGAIVEVVPHGADGHPPRHVEVREGERTSVLFRSGGVLSWAPEARAVRETTLFALGDGRVIYRAGTLGPILGFERMICPKELLGSAAPDALLILADVLVPSLFDLVVAVQRRAAGDMELQKRAGSLASIGPALFPFGERRLRPDGAKGELSIPLDNGFHLKLELRDGAYVALDLWGTNGDQPECEWIAGTTTYLHLFKRAADGPLRYAMQGLDLRERLAGLLPGGRIPGGDALVRRLLAAQLGSERSIPVQRAKNDER